MEALIRIERGKAAVRPQSIIDQARLNGRLNIARRKLCRGTGRGELREIGDRPRRRPVGAKRDQVRQVPPERLLSVERDRPRTAPAVRCACLQGFRMASVEVGRPPPEIGVERQIGVGAVPPGARMQRLLSKERQTDVLEKGEAGLSGDRMNSPVGSPRNERLRLRLRRKVAVEVSHGARRVPNVPLSSKDCWRRPWGGGGGGGGGAAAR